MFDDLKATKRRGRPVSARSRAAAVDAAVSLLDDAGWPGFSIDEVARRSGVGKATIYRHWSRGFPLAVEAWGDVVTRAVPTRSTGRVEEDLLEQVARLAGFYAGRRGQVAAQLIGASVGEADGPDLVARVFFGARRDATRALVGEGVRSGRLRRDVEPDMVIDLLFGPIVFRLFNGLGPLNPETARRVAGVAMDGIVTAPATRPIEC